MDQLQLAQFNKISNSSSNQGYNFLKNKKININSIFPKDCYVGLELDAHAGYTYLHFAAKNFDLPSIKELIKCNADLTKQDFKYGKTPLHILSGFLKQYGHNSREVFRYWGKMNEDKYVNILLLAQVKKYDVLNPKSYDGMSHLHIASMHNHIQAIELFLNAGESVDHSTNAKHSELPGYTALHFAVRYSAFEAADLLLKHGAKIHVKNLKDESSLHLLVRRLMDVSNFLTVGTDIRYLADCEKERDILESITKLFLENLKLDHATMPDDIGLTELHIACTLKNSTMVEKLLTQNIDCNVTINSNSKFWPGWTPLHFAACFSVETFKLLLRHGADFTIKNAKEETALDMCMQRYTLDILHSILSVREELSNVMLRDGSTKLTDVILAMNNDNKLEEFLERLNNYNITIEVNSTVWPGYNILHLAVLHEPIKYNYYKFSDRLVSQANWYGDSTYSKPPIWLHWRKIMNILSRATDNLYRKNVDGLIPIFLALKLFRNKSVDMILRPCKENFTNPDGLSHFHVACATGDLNSVQWFAENRNADIELPIKCNFEWYNKNNVQGDLITAKINSTPLHIAIIFNNTKVIQYLLDKNANADAKDSLGLTPIHLSTIHHTGASSISHLLFYKSCYKEDCVTEDRLSYLHVAACSYQGNVIRELLQNGADANVRFQPTTDEVKSIFGKYSSQTPLHTASAMGISEAVQALIEGGADIFAITGDQSRKVLYESIKINVSYHAVCEHFMLKLQQDYFDTTGPIDETGVTMLHFACLKREIKWVKNLLERGEDVNAQVILFGDKKDDFSLYWGGSTPMDILIFGLTWNLTNDSAEVIEIIKLLLKYGADVNVTNGRGYSPLHLMYYEATNEDSLLAEDIVLLIIDLLIESLKSFDVNSVDPYGLSHFHVACLRENLEVVRKFLNAGVDVNHSTIPCEVYLYPEVNVKPEIAYTPLHFTCDKKNSELARLLIGHGANVRSEDLRGDTPLHLVLKEGWFDTELIKLFLRCGADINAKNAVGITPLQYVVMRKMFSIEHFYFMLDHGASLDFMDMRHGNGEIFCMAITNAALDKQEIIFKEIIDRCDVESAIQNGFNAIESVVAVKNEGQMTIEFYFGLIKKFINMGCNVDQQDAKGNTAFHAAVRFYNIEAVEALLLFGADFNILNKNGESPLAKEVIDVTSFIGRRESLLSRLDEEMYKMQLIGLNVIEYNVLMIAKVSRHYRRNNQEVIRLTRTRELEKIEKIFIDKIALSYFLSDSGVMRYSSLPLLKRQAIDDFFKKYDNLRQEFPNWVGCLLLQYRKAVARAKMIEPAMEIIFSAGVELPALCLKQIVEYLGYDDMKILVAELT